MSTLLRPLALWLGYDLRTIRRSDSMDLCLKRYFANHETGLLIDAGGHYGEFGGVCRANGYRGPILSFEPSAASFAQLKDAAKGDPQWRVFQCALGAEQARLELHVNKTSVFNSLHKSRSDMVGRFGGLETLGVEEVQVERLADVLDKLEISPTTPVFLKSDTQGHDLEVLKGMGPRMVQVQALLLEMSVQQINEGAPSHWDTGAFVREAGFEAYGFSSVSRDTRGGLIEYDALFKRCCPAPTAEAAGAV